MTRALLDVNVLIALIDEAHTDHQRVHAWAAEGLAHGWASSAITQNGFIRILSQPAYPGSVTVAAAGKAQRRSPGRPPAWRSVPLPLLLGVLGALALPHLPHYLSPAKLRPQTPLLMGLHGTLLSPSRGLLVFCPFALAVVAAALRTRLWRAPLFRLAAAWLATQVLLLSIKGNWWGGHSYGPRLLTEAVPALALMAALAWQALPPPRRAWAASFLALGALAVAVNSAQGLWNPAVLAFNRGPDPRAGLELVLSWRYPQFLATSGSVRQRDLELQQRRLRPLRLEEQAGALTDRLVFVDFHPYESGWRRGGPRSSLRFRTAGLAPDGRYLLELRGSVLREQPVQAATRQELRALLGNRPSGGIVFATIQKFMPGEDEDVYPMLSERSNIVVIADEAHRTQYGFEARLKTFKQRGASALTTGSGGSGAVPAAEPRQTFDRYQVGYAQHLRDALPNATFVAFTGTPVSGEDRDTRAVFGDYISVYDMQQAKEDGATVAIYYESRLAKLGLKADELATIDDEVDELAEDEEESQQARLKSRWAALEKVVGAEPRIASVAADLVAHFEERSKTQTGKAMVVGMSRDICVHLYNEVVRLRPDWHSPDPELGAIKIVMTGSASDKALLRPHIYSAQVKKRLEKRYKDPADPLRVVIVRDMWLTGFDAPCMHTMYIDKPMKGHNLMQAIARVNRVFKDKQGGLVVDYIGIANELKSALKEYTASKGRGRPTVDAHEAFSVLAEKLDALRGMLHGFDYSGFLTGGHKTLAGAANRVLGIKDGKKRFADTALAMSKAFTLCCTLDEAKAVREEVAFFQAVKVILTKREITAQKKTDEERELAIRQIISSAVVSEEVVDIFDAVGLDKPNIGILDDAFLAEVRNLPERNLAVELLERLLEGEIKSRFAGNVVQNKKFSDMLTDVVQRYQNRSIEAAQVMEELVEMAKKFRAAAARGEQLGLTDDEVRFYDALVHNESAVRELTDATLKLIAHELTENLRQNLTVDWSARESVQARLRLMVKRILRKYKYPPDQQEAAVELVLQQAKALGEAWA